MTNGMSSSTLLVGLLSIDYLWEVSIINNNAVLIKISLYNKSFTMSIFPTPGLFTKLNSDKTSLKKVCPEKGSA